MLPHRGRGRPRKVAPVFECTDHSIRGLCNSLGFEDISDDPRHISKLSQLTASYSPALHLDGVCTTVNPSPESRECALRFIGSNAKLFQHKAVDRPSLPRDKEFIVDTLSRLFCKQAYTRRISSLRYLTSRSRLSGGSTAAKFEENCNGTVKKAKSSSARCYDGQVSKRPGAKRDVGLLAKANDRERHPNHDYWERIKFNIDEELNFVYPAEVGKEDQGGIEEQVTGKSCDIRELSEQALQSHETIGFLFKESKANAPWPPKLQTLVWRYMHEHEAYSLYPPIDQITCAVKIVEDYFHIECTPAQYAVIYEKTKRFLVFWTQELYSKTGLLDSTGKGQYERIEEFDQEFQLRRAAWNTAQKKGHGHRKSVKANAIPENLSIYGNGLVNKRQKTSHGASSFSTRTSNTRTKTRSIPAEHFEYSQEIKTEPANDDLGSDSSSLYHASPQRTIAPVVESESVIEAEIDPSNPDSVFDQHETSSSMSTVEPRSHSTVASNIQIHKSTPISTPATGMSSQTVASSFVPPIIPEVRPGSTAEVRSGALSLILSDGPYQEDKGSRTPSERPSSTHPARFQSMAAVNSKVSSSPSMLTPNSVPAKIEIILQLSNGVMDFDNPLPTAEFKNTSLSDFFSLYSLKSGIELHLIESITFMVMFASRVPIVARSTDSEQAWQRVKKRISSLYVMTRSERPQETDFEVWVKMGTTMAAQVIEDNDDLAGF